MSSLFELDGTVNQTLSACRGITVKLIWIHPTKIFTYSCFWIVRKKNGGRKGPSPDLSIRCRGEATDERLRVSRKLSEIIPLLRLRIETEKAGRIVTSKIDTVFMINGESPRTHLRGQGTVELSDLARIRDSQRGGKEGLYID